jgi:hypothetical protein
MKLDNPKRGNIMALMKDKLNQLETLSRELMCKLDVDFSISSDKRDDGRT